MEKTPLTTNKQTLRWFWRFTRPDRRLFLASNTLSAFATLIQDVLPPLIAAYAFTRIQELYKQDNEFSFWSVDHYAWIYVGLIFTGFVLWRIQVICAWTYEIRSQKRIYKYVFNHLQRQPASFHANSFGGALVSHTNKFSSAYEKMMDELQWSIVTSATILLSSITILSFVAPLYALGLLVACVSYIALMTWLRTRDGHVDAALAASESDRTAKLADAITNIATVRSFARESYENELFGKQVDETARAYFRLLRVVARNEVISHASTSTLSIVSFIGGLALVSYFNATLGVLFLIINYTLRLSQTLRDSNRTIRNVVRAFGDAASLTEILKLQPAIVDAPSASSPTIQRGRIVFDKVAYGYDDNKKVFESLDLVIKPGEKIGLVGRSGGGKSTLTKLLVREDDLNTGTISIDGHDIASMTLESLRGAISLVPQEPMLFHRTIGENISYGSLEANQEAIEAAAKTAHAHEFIADLPQGYDTLVGERGVKLSGGQRQRIAIARAMLKNAPILLLDEATSALDSESEVLIQDGLWKLMEGKTTIVIAHRLSTIQRMDRIIVLDNGHISEQGSHKDLLHADGAYASLWKHQSGGFIEE